MASTAGVVRKRLWHPNNASSKLLKPSACLTGRWTAVVLKRSHPRIPIDNEQNVVRSPPLILATP